jgi:AcrR family transcriptional regulator
MTRAPRRTRTRLDPETRREQIIEAAERVLVGRDPAEVSFEELAAEAGVSRALLYNYFGDKAGLVAAVYLRVLEGLSEEIDAAVGPEAGDVADAERLRVLARCYLSYAAEHASAWRLLGSSLAMDHPSVRRARHERFETLMRRRGGVAGPEARLTVCAVIGFLEAGSLQWLESGAHDLDRSADLLATILWSGLAAVQARAERPGVSSTRQQYQAATLR